MEIALIGGLLCGFVALMIRVFGSADRSGRKTAIAAIWIGVCSPIFFTLVAWREIFHWALLIFAAPVIPGVITLLIPPKRGVRIFLRVISIVSLVAVLVGVICFWISLTAPSGISLEQPVEISRTSNVYANPFGFVPAVDVEAQRFFGAATQPIPATQRISVDLPFLDAFSGPDRQLLIRHLITSAKWDVGKEFGDRLHAARRFARYGMRFNSEVDYNHPEQPNLTIGLNLDGPRAGKNNYRTYTIVLNHQDCLVGIDISPPGNPLGESNLIVNAANASAEIREEGKSPYRSQTAAALSQLNLEFQSVLASPVARKRGFDPALMPAESIRRGNAEIHLIDYGLITGQYQVVAYLNPGESGYVHLKVFQGRQTGGFLQQRDPGHASVEYTGWSSDPNEQFLYCTEFTFSGLGISGKSYASRVEAWFVPSSGGLRGN